MCAVYSVDRVRLTKNSSLDDVLAAYSLLDANFTAGGRDVAAATESI
jgi:hypothetical protein